LLSDVEEARQRIADTARRLILEESLQTMQPSNQTAATVAV
jgi:hypothetical protein